MARDRTKDEILDQLVYAVAAVAYHYGPGLGPEGLKEIRDRLADRNWRCDSNWRVDVMEKDYYGDEHQPGFNEEEPNPDFTPSVIGMAVTGLNFEEVARQSRTGQD